MINHLQKAIIDKVSPTKTFYGWATYGINNNTDNAPDKAKPVWKICLVEDTGTVREEKRPLDTKSRANNNMQFVWNDRATLTFI
jgi:hypothetical protein